MKSRNQAECTGGEPSPPGFVWSAATNAGCPPSADPSALFTYVYELSPLADPGRRYTGITHDLQERLAKHNGKGVPSTRDGAPWQMDVALAFRDKVKAAIFEKYLKTHSGRAFAARHF